MQAEGCGAGVEREAPGDVKDPVAQPLGLAACELAGEQELGGVAQEHYELELPLLMAGIGVTCSP